MDDVKPCCCCKRDPEVEVTRLQTRVVELEAQLAEANRRLSLFTRQAQEAKP